MTEIACPYCLAAADEPCRSHQKCGTYPEALDRAPGLVKRPHIERLLRAAALSATDTEGTA